MPSFNQLLYQRGRIGSIQLDKIKWSFIYAGVLRRRDYRISKVEITNIELSTIS